MAWNPSRSRHPTTCKHWIAGFTMRIPSVPGWSGRVWARTGCTFDESGNGTCQTGDCGGRLECNGMGATPPASLFEVTLGTGDVKDYYDVSLVDGYNLPLVAAPVGVHGECNATGCVSDINMGKVSQLQLDSIENILRLLGCPKELQLVGDDGGEGGVVACKSRACPRAYSYAFDDGTSIFTCKADDYAIIFCPTAKGIKTPDGAQAASMIPNPSNGKTMKLVSSSNILQPLPLLFLLLILYLTLCA
uniref:Thaumatin-like protein n=1 Tax=Salix viminalis TaxID=40686 RepID=A0A6N2M1Z3_SALVM